jgi:hypothetical protein
MNSGRISPDHHFSLCKGRLRGILSKTFSTQPPDASFVPPRIRHDNPLPVILKSQGVTEESGGGRNLDLSEQIIQLIFNPLWIRQAHHERILILDFLAMTVSAYPDYDEEVEAISTDFFNTALRSIRKRLLCPPAASSQKQTEWNAPRYSKKQKGRKAIALQPSLFRIKSQDINAWYTEAPCGHA